MTAERHAAEVAELVGQVREYAAWMGRDASTLNTVAINMHTGEITLDWGRRHQEWNPIPPTGGCNCVVCELGIDEARRRLEM